MSGTRTVLTMDQIRKTSITNLLGHIAVNKISIWRVHMVTNGQGQASMSHVQSKLDNANCKTNKVLCSNDVVFDCIIKHVCPTQHSCSH